MFIICESQLNFVGNAGEEKATPNCFSATIAGSAEWISLCMYHE